MEAACEHCRIGRMPNPIVGVEGGLVGAALLLVVLRLRLATTFGTRRLASTELVVSPTCAAAATTTTARGERVKSKSILFPSHYLTRTRHEPATTAVAMNS